MVDLHRRHDPTSARIICGKSFFFFWSFFGRAETRPTWLTRRNGNLVIRNGKRNYSAKKRKKNWKASGRRRLVKSSGRQHEGRAILIVYSARRRKKLLVPGALPATTLPPPPPPTPVNRFARLICRRTELRRAKETFLKMKGFLLDTRPAYARPPPPCI